jgi:hypothetical protein
MENRRRRNSLGALILALLCFGIPASASASWEQTGCFAGTGPDPCKPVAKEVLEKEGFSEEVQLGGVGGMAVNTTGAGGVPKGTVYAMTSTQAEKPRVAMFVPQGASLVFDQAWQVTLEEEAYEHCGPALVQKCSPQFGHAPDILDVEVDQATGDVFVYNGRASLAGQKAVVVYKSDGSQVLARFGEIAAFGKTTAETPGQIHESRLPGGIAINGAGEVFVYDVNSADLYHRLMVFKPQSPGDFEHYVYAGEVAAQSGRNPTHPVTDAAGNVYTNGDGVSIEMYRPESPAAYPAPPATAVCRYEFAKGGIEPISVDPASGEVFFYSYKTPKRVWRLGPCDEGTGKFTELTPEPEMIAFTPERGDLGAITFDAGREVQVGRGPGTLYAGAAEGAGKPGQSSLGYVFAQVEENAPEVISESVSRVTSTEALLHASIDPNGHQTHYAFQYLSEAEYEANPPGERFAGAKEAPLGGAVLGEGSKAFSVSASVGGLVPDSGYRYRAIAASNCSAKDPAKVCADEGEAQAFRTFPLLAAGLPDRRAYELVSPTQKNSGQVIPSEPNVRTCPGECNKPGELFTHFPMQSSPDGEAIVYEGSAFKPGEGATIENQYRAKRTASGWQSTNLTPALLQSGTGNCTPKGYKAFSTDLKEGLLEQFGPALGPQAPAQYANLYSQPTTEPLALGPPLLSAPAPNRSAAQFQIEYAGASADLSRVFFAANDALSDATPPAPPVAANKFDLYEWQPQTNELRLVNLAPGDAEAKAGASFGTGSAHTISADGSRAFWSDEAGQLYVREDANTTKAIPDPGKFLAAATDGSKVLLTNGHLYDLEAETTTDLTAGAGGFEGIAGQSDDLSHVYFVDSEVLSGEEENGEGDKAQEGQNNLYSWSEGTIGFVTTLVANDNNPLGSSATSDWAVTPTARSAQASPGGRYLAFLSKAPLTGYDNTGPCETDHEGGFVSAPCAEVFLYDSASGKLRCASCNPSEATPLGWSLLPLVDRLGYSYLPQAHYLSDSGRLLFDSHDALIPADTNGGFEDVYEYEPQGVGDCKREAGCTSLVSAGTGIADSNFLAMDESGANVFFTTRDQLVQKDTDDLVDLYDARVEGGIAAESGVARSECQGEACQAPVSAPNDPTPGSSSFEGAGNVDEKKHAKKHKKKRKHAKKHAHKRAAKHNRGGAK